MGLKPWEVCELDIWVIEDLLQAQQYKEDDDFDKQMIQLSWQTALLMNSTGNYKKKIKPEDLYTPLEEQKEKAIKRAEGLNPKKRKELQADLLSAFADSDVVIQ